MNDKITVDRDLLRQVLDAPSPHLSDVDDFKSLQIVRASLRAMLDAEPAPVQQPTAHISANGIVHADGYPWSEGEVLTPLYTEAQLIEVLRDTCQAYCKWPAHQPVQYQQDLAEQVAKELLGIKPSKAGKLTEDAKYTVIDEYTHRRIGLLDLANLIEAAVRTKLGITE